MGGSSRKPAAVGSTEAALEVIRRPRQASAILQPTRRALLESLGQPASAATLARRLSLPRQRVNYHLRELEKEGLVELVEERRKGNCVERVVRATARSYLISPEALGLLGAGAPDPRDRLSATYLVASAARVIREVAAQRARAQAAGKRLATLTLETEVRFRRAEERHAFVRELAESLAALAARYHDAEAPGGRMFRFVVGGYPAVPREETGAGVPDEEQA